MTSIAPARERAVIRREPAFLRGVWGEAATVVALALALWLATWAAQLRGGAVIRGDFAAFFVPMYDFMGEAIRAGRIPGWNPAQFAGLPFAGDPGSGWGYLPAMLLFALLTPLQAVPLFMLFHVLLAGLGTYALGRGLGLGRAGSVIAGLAFGLTWIADRTTCCPAFFQLTAWLPLLLLGGAWAMERRGWAGRLPGYALAGFAISQMLAAWIGQGIYYLLLVYGAFLLYRALVAPVAGRGRGRGLLDAVLAGGVPLLLGLLLSALGTLPRLELTPRTNVAGGEYEVAIRAALYQTPLTPERIVAQLTDGDIYGAWWYAGGAVLALAFAALVAARRWRWTPFFALTTAGGLLLTLPDGTPFHQTLYLLLPRFETLHSHQPERALIVIYLPLAMLAGAAIDAALRANVPRREVVGGAALAAAAWAAALLWNAAGGPQVPLPAVLAAGAALLLLLQGAFFAGPARALVPLALALVVIWDPLHPFLGSPPSALDRTNTPPYDLATQVRPTAAAEWLRERAADGRYIGYDPAVVGRERAQMGSYRVTREDPEVWHLLIDDQATLHGLETIQGYNPAQLRRFTLLMDAINSMPQEYHEANVFPSGIDSPLLDPLGVRYLVVPAAGREGLDDLLARYPEVYADEWVRILERPSAFPFAWMVHDLREAADPAAAIAATAGLDLRAAAVLEEEPPPAAAVDGAESVDVLERGPGLARLRVAADAPGVLVVSQAYDPGWQATVNGAEARVLPVDGALQGVAISAGASEVELRYRPWTLGAGLAISSIAAALLLAALAVASARLRRKRRSAT